MCVASFDKPRQSQNLIPSEIGTSACATGCSAETYVPAFRIKSPTRGEGISGDFMITKYNSYEVETDDLAGIHEFITNADIVEGPDELFELVKQLWPELLLKLKPPRSLMHYCKITPQNIQPETNIWTSPGS